MSKNLPGGKGGLYLSLALSISSVAIILAVTVDENTLESVLRLRPAFLALAGFMVVITWLLEGLRIRSIAWAMGYRGVLRLRDAIRVFLVTYFFAGITPLALGEWPAQIYTLCRAGLSPGESAAVALVRGFFTKLIFVTLAAFLLFIDGRASSGSGLIFRLFRYTFWIITATTGVYLLMLWQSGLAQSVLERLKRYRRFQSLYERKPRVRRFISKLLAEAVQFEETVHQFNRKNMLHFFLPLLYTFFFWGVFYAIGPVLLLGLGVQVDLRSAITWQIMIMLMIPYIPVPGGSGAAEFGLATLFAAFVPSHILGVFIIAWRFFTYYVTMIFGGIIAFGVRK